MPKPALAPESPDDREVPDLTELLHEIRSGDPAAQAELIELVYGELKRLARNRLRGERPNHTLQATALVHEAFIKLTRGRSIEWVDRKHFFAVAAEVMHQLLLDYARKRRAAKRNGGIQPVEILDHMAVSDQNFDQILDVSAAMELLNSESPRSERAARVVQLRVFGGLDLEQIGEVLGVTRKTVGRDWKYATAFLVAAMGGRDGTGGSSEADK